MIDKKASALHKLLSPGLATGLCHTATGEQQRQAARSPWLDRVRGFRNFTEGSKVFFLAVRRTKGYIYVRMVGRTIKRFTTVIEILELYAMHFPNAKVSKARDEHDSLMIRIDHGGRQGIEHIPVRDCQTSQYFITEVPAA